MKDTYKTILRPSEEVLFKDRNSKFFGCAFPINNEEEVKTIIKSLKKQHHSARHWCYAYQLGRETMTYRVNDDGEPNNSAGMPIYGQLQSFGITNVLIVVVRYFGGTKLGVGGLINAYKTSAKMALEASEISERTINKVLVISCNYENLNQVMRIIKEKKLSILDQTMELNCLIKVEIRLSEADQIFDLFKILKNVTVKYSEN